MFLGRVWRKKRQVLLPALRTPQAPRRAMSWRPPVHNAPGIERNWYESIIRSHASSCGCGNFILHINSLADRYGFAPGPSPPGGPGPRPPAPLRRQNATENPDSGPRALPWRGDGGGDGGPGPEGGDGGSGGAADQYAEEELDALFAAVERDE